MKKSNTATPKLLTPLQGLWRWLVPAVVPNAAIKDDTCATFLASPLEPTRCAKQRPNVVLPLHASTRPLRVVRVLDADEPPASHGGRMMISGRMADVCAELDRLAAGEQTVH